MLLNIQTIEELEHDINDIDNYLNITCSEDPNECIERGLTLMVYLARTSKMLADARYHKDRAVKASILKELRLDISASILKQLIESTCERENYLVNWVDRINSTIVHQMDMIRTIISKSKVEMYQNRNIG